MINFNDSKDQTPSALAVLGMVLIGGACIFSVFFGRGMDARTYATKARTDIENLKKRSLVAKSDNSVYTDSIDKYQWKEAEDVVTPMALTIVSRRIDQNKLRLVNFRPLKSTESNSIVQLPLQMTVDGSFASVVAMLDSIEKSDSKLVVQQVQFASQEADTDLVSANISLLAFLAKPVVAKSKSIGSPKTPATSTSTAGNDSKAATKAAP